MFSLGGQLSAMSNPSLMHSFVDSFFLGKKALVKERLRQSMETVLDGLFEEMVQQVKEMLLPPKVENYVQVKSSLTVPNTSSPVKSVTTLPAFEKPKTNPVFAAKSKPGPSTSAQQHQQPPFSGLYKRMAEEDESGTHPKKKAITVELKIDEPLGDDDAGYDDDDDAGGDDDVDDFLDNHFSSVANKQQQQPKPKAAPKTESKVPCPEPGCGKLFLANNLKRHLRTVHSQVKPYCCTFPGCSLEFNQRENAIRHIQNVHLKNAEEGGDEPPDPASYLSVKEELL